MNDHKRCLNNCKTGGCTYPATSVTQGCPCEVCHQPSVCGLQTEKGPGEWNTPAMWRVARYCKNPKPCEVHPQQVKGVCDHPRWREGVAGICPDCGNQAFGFISPEKLAQCKKCPCEDCSLCWPQQVKGVMRPNDAVGRAKEGELLKARYPDAKVIYPQPLPCEPPFVNGAWGRGCENHHQCPQPPATGEGWKEEFERRFVNYFKVYEGDHEQEKSVPQILASDIPLLKDFIANLIKQARVDALEEAMSAVPPEEAAEVRPMNRTDSEHSWNSCRAATLKALQELTQS